MVDGWCWTPAYRPGLAWTTCLTATSTTGVDTGLRCSACRVGAPSSSASRNIVTTSTAAKPPRRPRARRAITPGRVGRHDDRHRAQRVTTLGGPDGGGQRIERRCPVGGGGDGDGHTMMVRKGCHSDGDAVRAARPGPDPSECFAASECVVRGPPSRNTRMHGPSARRHRFRRDPPSIRWAFRDGAGNLAGPRSPGRGAGAGAMLMKTVGIRPSSRRLPRWARVTRRAARTATRHRPRRRGWSSSAPGRAHRPCSSASSPTPPSCSATAGSSSTSSTRTRPASGGCGAPTCRTSCG